MARERLGIAVALAALTVSGGALAQSASALCEFVKVVLESKPSFDTLKGEAQNPAVFHYEVFHGAVLPNPKSLCTLFLKTRAGRVTLPPRYSCTLAQADEFAEGNRVFQRAQADLKACFPDAKFTTKYDGDGQAPDEPFDWTATADQPGFRLELQMTNGIAAFAAALSQNDPNAPPIAIDLDVVDTTDEK